jgi:hypothetical protein
VRTTQGGLCAALLAGAVASGCAGDTVIFTTKTSFGIDLEQTPASVSVGYDRVEGYLGPRFPDGGAPVVVGAFVTQGTVLDRSVRQVYATGNAALGVTGQTYTPGNASLKGKGEPMFFGTTSTFGLKVAVAESALNSFTVGYKRKEVSVIPLTTAGVDGSFVYPSVLASLDSSYAVAKADALDPKVGVTQFFATGGAAEKLSQRKDVQQLFDDLRDDALLKYREQERQQRRLALNTLFCLSAVEDAKVPQVWANAASVKIFDDPSIIADLKSQGARQARTTYADNIRRINADSAEYTGRMAGHHAYVCELAGMLPK